MKKLLCLSILILSSCASIDDQRSQMVEDLAHKVSQSECKKEEYTPCCEGDIECLNSIDRSLNNPYDTYHVPYYKY